MLQRSQSEKCLQNAGLHSVSDNIQKQFAIALDLIDMFSVLVQEQTSCVTEQNYPGDGTFNFQ